MRGRIIAVVGALALGAFANKPQVAIAAGPARPAIASPIPAATYGAVADTTYEIREIGDRTTYRFEPDTLTINEGDAVRFVMVSGGPHNVVFDPTKLSEVARTALSAGMPGQVAELSGRFLMQPAETYTISFKNVPAGAYEFFCAPHLAMNQRGMITVVGR